MPVSGSRLVRVGAALVVAVDGTAADAGALGPRTPVNATAAAPAVKPVARVLRAPDLVSARVAARAQGARVEVTGPRDEFPTTWVNPDGTLTTQAHGGPVRLRVPADPHGPWRDVDLTR